jgi:hypothetical protein
VIRARCRLDEDAFRRALEDRAEVDAAYVFGSHARGHPNRLSDLDVGVFVDKRKLARRALPDAYEVDLALRIETETGIRRVEVVVLNDASPLLAWEAVRRGRRLFARGRRAVIAHEAAVRRRYLDTAPLRAIQDRYLDVIVRRGFSRAVGP